MCLFTNNCTPPLQLFALSPPSRLPPTPPHIPIPSPKTPTKIAPAGDTPESAANMSEPVAAMLIPAVVMPESTAISSATIPISPEPHLIPPVPKPIPSEPHLISSESTVKLGSWHEIVIAKPAIITASPAITISHPAIRINIISTHAARVSAFAAWVAFCVRSERFLLRSMAQRNSKI